jgi:hypothetical protein
MVSRGLGTQQGCTCHCGMALVAAGWPGTDSLSFVIPL